jgi:dihydrofolate reductase
MGRKTYDSIFKRLGKPLPGRKNVVITRNPEFKAPSEVLVFHNIPDALEALKSEDVYIIGGEQIFRQTFPDAKMMYITHVHKDYPGDAFFPEINWSDWEKTEEEPHDNYSFATYVYAGK